MKSSSKLASAVTRKLDRWIRFRGPGGPRIREVELARYVGPGRLLGRSHGLVACLIADHAGERLSAYGEAVVTGGQSDVAWRQLKKIAAGLVDAELPGRPDPARPFAHLDGWRGVSRVERGAIRGAKLAIEMALLDLLMKASRVSPAQWWGVEEHRTPAAEQTVLKLPRVAPGSSRDSLSGVLASEPGTSWALKLQVTGQPDLDLAWLRRAAQIESDAGRSRPLWVTGAALEAADAELFVSEVAALLASAEIPGEVLIEEPIARSALSKLRERSVLPRAIERPRLSQLQKIADEALDYKRGKPGQRRLTVVAGDSANSVAQVRRLCGQPSIGGLHLSLARFGSLVALREAAQVARKHSPETRVLLGGGRGSRLTGIALEAVLACTTEIERYVPEQRASAWPTLVPVAPADQRVGLLPDINISHLAAVADGLASFPHGQPKPTGERANEFPGHPLLGVSLSPRSMLLEIEALRAGWRTRRLARHYFLAEDPTTAQAIGFYDSESSATSAAASVIALRKGATRELLANRGLPVPEGAFFGADEHDKAYKFGIELGFPLVVKPGGGSKGIAVTPGVTSAGELSQALADVAGCTYARSGVVVERFVTGNDHRILATADAVISVVRRDPASVVGDGKRTIEELVLASNVARRKNPHLARRLVPLDARVDALLKRQEMERTSIPTAGQRVQLSAAANLHQGGDSRELLDSTHPTLLKLATSAVAAIPGLPHAGLDVLLEDHRLPVDEQTISIIEVNSRAVQTVHHFPMFGPPRNVSATLVREAITSTGSAVPEGTEELAVRVTVSGRVQRVGYRHWMARTAAQLGVTGWVSNTDQPDEVDALIHGPVDQVGLMLRMAFNGPTDAAVNEVRAEPVAVPRPASFGVRKASGGADRG